jgi:hypothetical protein
MVRAMKHAVVLSSMLIAGCATAPATQQDAAAIGGAVGCLAQGVAAAADSGKGELVAIGIALMPLCAMLAASNQERFHPQRPWTYGGARKSRVLASRK